MTILGGIAALALAGCNNNTGGTAGPSPSSTTATAGTSTAVANPLDTTKLQQNLCTGLTAAQLTPYVGQVKNTSSVNKTDYSGCDMFPTDVHMAAVSVNVYPNTTPSAMIAANSNFPYSKNLAPIQGYTARDTSLLPQPQGKCATAVAVADHVVVEVEVEQSDASSQYYNNTCAASEALVTTLVGNLKASG
ncbi:DUF3558 family protein [Kutzneria buriramensis]|uniref:DUF3558 family protein n=1 Tax=Kutzneria buriramensis TaxID=1045776 RepID=UPI0014769B8B|nr:DUF3558 family protein [Kutzneria buriramensis]